MSMCSLHGFPAMAPEGHIALCELEGRLQIMPAEHANVLTFTHATSNHPAISITQELLHPHVGIDVRQVFLPVEEPLLKRFFSVWCADGLIGAFNLAVEESENGNSHPVLNFGVSFISIVRNAASRVRNFFDPYHKERGDALISSVSQTRFWRQSRVRCIAWHPHSTKIAVAIADDSIRVYSSDSSLTPVLKSKRHRAVCCMAWRPLSASELAVGYDDGILIWNVDPNSVVTRLSPSCATVLQRSKHAPVTGLAWNSEGSLLLSASAADTTMHIWDISMETSAPLHKLGGGGVGLITWSPDSTRVLAATSGIVFRVWKTRHWTSELWTVQLGRVQTACWSPCSSMVLFATTEEPFVYSLLFQRPDIAFKSHEDNVANKALPVIDLTPIELDDGTRVGGPVTSMVWDNKGFHLAILFRDCDVIALYRTSIQTVLQVSPCCFLRGLSQEIPSAISFQQNFKEGSLLTIAWSSGRIQYFPLIVSSLGHESITYPESHQRSINTPIVDISQRINFRAI